jgi:hypothetical protein
VGRWKRKIEPEDLFLCQWIGGRQIAQLGLRLDGGAQTPAVFERAIKKLLSSPLLAEAFQRWCEIGEGMQRFPLDPLNPANWDPTALKHPEAFSARAEAPTA